MKVRIEEINGNMVAILNGSLDTAATYCQSVQTE